MSNPTSLLGDVIGFARDHALDAMPRGYVWDMGDYIPRRAGAKLQSRGPWSYFSTALAANIWGGKHAGYRAGAKLMAGAGGTLYDINQTTGAVTSIGAVPVGVQNGVLLRDRVYFADAAGAVVPKVVTHNGTSYTLGAIHSGAPKGTLMGAYKDRLLLSGALAQPSYVYFSLLEVDGGPSAAWDALSFLGTTRAVTALMPMTAQILVFHDGSIEKIRGSIPPGTNVDTDMSLDVFSEQIGTSDPASVVPWQENVCFANHHGVYLTDGSTIRSLTDQGGIGDLWRQLYDVKRSGTQVHAMVFLDKLHITVLTNWSTGSTDEERPITLVCDLPTRAWWRFKNIHATAYIDSEIGEEEVWWGVDNFVPSLGSPRLVKLSPLYFGPTEFDPATSPTAPDAIDGNTLPVLPNIRTGWHRLGPEGVKRMRNVYVSHITQAQTQNRADVLEVGVAIDPYPNLDPVSFGKLAAAPRYKRERLRVGRRSYGIQVEVKQVLPSYLSRLYDISVDAWPQDRGKL